VRGHHGWNRIGCRSFVVPPMSRGGLKVAVAMVGALLPGDIAIKRAKLRGVESNGMLCSARETGLGGKSRTGIMELPAGLSLGVDVRQALDLEDTALEVNATPNRGDCMSVFGLAPRLCGCARGPLSHVRPPCR